MRIVHVIGSIDPRQGGPPVVATRLAAAQAALGQEVHILHGDTGPWWPLAKQVAQAVPGFDRVTVASVGRAGPLTRWTGSHARFALERLLGPGDVVHLHGVWESILPAAAGAARYAEGIHVLTPHGMLDPWSLAQKRWKKRLALALGYRRMLRRAAFLHALHDDEAALLLPLGLPVPARVISNGVFLQEFELLPEAGRFRRRHGLAPDRPLLLFLARLHAKKGLDLLLEALARLRRSGLPALLAVAGPDGGAEAAARQQARDLGLEDGVVWVGPLYGRDKLEALVDADCFCLPSRQEGFSIAVLEALACGRPVVISRACHFLQVAAAGAGEVVDLWRDGSDIAAAPTPTDVTALADALQKVLADPAGRQAMGQAGRRLIEEHYTWPRIARRMLDAYEDALRARGMPV